MAIEGGARATPFLHPGAVNEHSPSIQRALNEHPCERSEHKKCGVLSMDIYMCGGIGQRSMPPHIYISIECAPTALSCATGGLSQMCHPSRVSAWGNSGNVKHSTSIWNISANLGNVKHPCERSEHKKCGALSMRLSFMATWLVPSHGTQTHRVCAYRFVYERTLGTKASLSTAADGGRCKT